MEKFKELAKLCRGEVMIETDEHFTPFWICGNPHHSSYKNVEQYFKEHFSRGDALEEIPEDVYKEMCKRNTIFAVQFYPNTPNGFYRVYHYDIDMALDIALDIVKGKG